MEGIYTRFLGAVEFEGLVVNDKEFCVKIIEELEEDCGINLDKIDKIKERIKNKNEIAFLKWLGF